jgi:hypothetical protein
MKAAVIRTTISLSTISGITVNPHNRVASSALYCTLKIMRSPRNNNKGNTTTAVAAASRDVPARKARNSKVKALTQKTQLNTAATNPNRSKGKKNTSAISGGGRGESSKGKGKAGMKGKKNIQKKKPLTAEELDKQMDDYMMRNEKTAEKVLEDQMDEYWAKKGKSDDDNNKNDDDNDDDGEVKVVE